jgi:hypothetical protein
MPSKDGDGRKQAVASALEGDAAAEEDASKEEEARIAQLMQAMAEANQVSPFLWGA